jgi:adenylate kinase family enzyme
MWKTAVKRIVIFGNSGSGKSTLARAYRSRYGLAHLDLDTLAWEPTGPPVRRPVAESKLAIDEFTGTNDEWVIEGIYADLLALVADEASEAIFLNPGVEQCVANCLNRPWEPHKYATKQEQDENLEMLIDWVKQYPERTNELSLASHRALFKKIKGKKVEHRSNLDLPPALDTADS